MQQNRVTVLRSKRHLADRNASIPDVNLEAEGLYEVTVDPKPDATGKITEKEQIKDRNGRPYQTWVERDPTPEEFALHKEKTVYDVNNDHAKALTA